ncbi:MAG: hypothetical protein JST54_26435 [Deltaproteobacteria bacterium]|nr:hypothetical protein [Deltaproteobacteria bacterium]
MVMSPWMISGWFMAAFQMRASAFARRIRYNRAVIDVRAREQIVYGVFGVLVLAGALVAWDHFRDKDLRAVTTECATNLRGFCQAEAGAYKKFQRYLTTVDDVAVGYVPQRGNRYTYYLDANGPMERRDEKRRTPVADAVILGPDTWMNNGVASVAPDSPLPEHFAGDVPLGVSGECPACSMVIACAANLHESPSLDVWSVSTAPRKRADGSIIPACEPFHDRDGLDGAIQR